MTKDTPTVLQKVTRVCASVIGLILLLAAPASAQNFTIAPDPFLTVLDNSGLIVVGSCVWTYAAGTTTPISTYSNNSGTTNTNPIIADTSGRYTAYLLAGTNYKFVYETACTPPAHGAVLRTADNISGVPAAAATVDVSCVAGETISAGQAAYLSNGSGGKTAGQCFKGDSANTYSSSTATVFGIAPAAIVSGNAGTVRIAGSVTGLSSLTPGSDYYIGSAGAITSTAPANARKLGAADTATSIILSLPTSLNTDNGVDDFRLTLTTGTPVTTADVLAATTIFATPGGKGNRIALFDVSGVPTVYTSAEFSIAVPATTSQMYDIFAFVSGSTPTLELLAWTNDTTRATAIVLTTTGTYTKSGDLTRRYLGSFRTTTVSGQTEDSTVKRYLWNYYNRVPRLLQRYESTASWTYTTATVRQANASVLNQVDVVTGVAETPMDLALTTGASGQTTISAGIGENSTTTYVVGQSVLVNASGSAIVVRLVKTPAVGRNFYSWNEWSTAVNTTTWNGAVAAVGSNITSGLIGWIQG